MDKTALDEKILQLGPRMSPIEISEAINGVLSPTEVASRAQELLSSRDWLSTLQKKQILIERTWGLLDVYERYALDGNLKSADIMLRAIKELRTMLAQDSNELEDEIMKITSAQAQHMAKAIGASFTLLLEELKVSEDEALPILDRVMVPAVTALEKVAE